MISADIKATIDALSKDDLHHEIGKESQSRFQEDHYAYLKDRLTQLEQQEAAANPPARGNEGGRRFSWDQISAAIALVLSVLTLLVGGGWYQEYRKAQDTRNEVVRQAQRTALGSVLGPISMRLNENSAIYREMRLPDYVEGNWGILDSYLIKIRRDGVKKNAYMKSRIDALVHNNNEIVTLLRNYAPETEDLKVNAAAFIEHATRYNSRWTALIDIFESGGYFPTGQPPFPIAFVQALQIEEQRRKELLQAAGG